jgi:hypothetical protein
MDWKAIISSVAPWIGTALGGPIGGMAVTAVSNALGLSDKTEAGIKQALSGVTPEQMLALKEADNSFSLQMQALGFQNQKDLAKLNDDDRANARLREMTVKDRLPAILAIFVTLGFFGILAFMMNFVIPATNKDVLNILLGSLGTAWISVVSYYFGSSAGSDKKTEIMGANL